MTKKSKLVLMLVAFFAVLTWSGIHPHDRLTWFLEISPAVGALILLALTYGRFEFTTMTYFLIMIHSMILMVGGKYTYAEVPLFNWIRDTFHTARNSYDGVGHFAQGFIPAIVTREILLRTSPLKRGKWLTFISISIVLALSALYELVEWWVSLATGSAGDSFLGTQGDVWDTQKDMGLCLLGSIVSLLILSKAHDKALTRLAKE
jgi:putative membrane protein